MSDEPLIETELTAAVIPATPAPSMATCVFSHVDETLSIGNGETDRTTDASSKILRLRDAMTGRVGIDLMHEANHGSLTPVMQSIIKNWPFIFPRVFEGWT